MQRITNKVHQNCTISDLKSNLIFSARHVTVLITNHELMKQS